MSPVEKQFGHCRVVFELLDVTYYIVEHDHHVHLPGVHVRVWHKLFEYVVDLVGVLLNLLHLLLDLLALLSLSLDDTLLGRLGYKLGGEGGK